MYLDTSKGLSEAIILVEEGNILEKALLRFKGLLEGLWGYWRPWEGFCEREILTILNMNASI